jgi:endonuclease/exonuclease/phosphatase family metal-dependent hydrolase
VVNTLAPDSTFSVYLSGGFHPKKPILTGGIAIISKFPIVHKGEIFTEKSNYANRSIFTDIRVNSDTIRIVNLHFHSMVLNPLPSTTNLSSMKQFTIDTYARVKSGLLFREKQANMILDFINNSPYPVIVAGDFNEIPYGYVYRKFSKFFDNAFEEAGNGFGFSINTTFPFLRIDNQFYDANTFDAIHYTTFREISISEHYPIQTVYRFIK